MGAIHASNPTAVHHASQLAHHWPTTTILGAPTFIPVATGVMGAVVPYQFNLGPPIPEGMPHVPAPQFAFAKTIHPPKVVPVAKDTANVAEVLLVIVVVLVIAGRIYVRLLDAAGNLLARADG